jgi:hypothetical protein
VEKKAQELGYEFGRWTGERLATYLAEQTGIELSGSQVRRILKRKKYSYIWAKYSLEDKQDPVKELSLEKLAKYLLIAKQQPEHLQIWFWDETGFSLRVIRRKAGVREEQERKLQGSGGMDESM